MQFVDLAAQQEKIYGGLLDRIKKVLSHGKYIMGPEILELEKELSNFCGAEYAVTCSSGTDALLMSLMALGIKTGDLVFTTPFTFIATAEVICLLGAIPVFVDIDPKTFNIDPMKLKMAIHAVQENDPNIHPLPNVIQEGKGQFTPKGIITVDLFGLPAEYDLINEQAEANGLFIIGDAAQSFGATYHGKSVGTLCDITATSFFPAKPLGCYGDGGAIFTNDEELSSILRSIRVHGKGKDKYDNIRTGINGRLDTIQAAILLEKLKIFPQEIEARDEVASKYNSRLIDWVKTPYVPPGVKSAWAQYSILCDSRDELQSFLGKAGIPTAVYYPKPLHLQKAFWNLGYKHGDFPVAEEISSKILSLPMHPYLTDEQVEKITNEIISFYR